MASENKPVEKFYGSNEGFVQLLSLILIPLTICVVGYLISFSFEQKRIEQENSKIAADYLRIATGILSQKVEVEVNRPKYARGLQKLLLSFRQFHSISPKLID